MTGAAIFIDAIAAGAATTTTNTPVIKLEYTFTSMIFCRKSIQSLKKKSQYQKRLF